MHGQGQMSKERAQLAGGQAAKRKVVGELSQEEGKDGSGNPGDGDKLAKEAQNTEEDLVNKVMTEDMVIRQQYILVRLLEAEKAQKERKTSPERESKIPDDISKNIPPSLAEYLKKRQAEVDLYKTVPPSLKPFYRNLVENYFKSISLGH